MDLELLKEVWQKTTEKNVEGYFISTEKMKEVIKKRSNTAVSQIKKGIFNKVFKAGGIGLFMLFFSIIIFEMEDPIFSFLESVSNKETGIFYIVFGLVICFISAFNAYSYRKIIHIENYETNLKTSITSVLKVIQKAISVKIISDAVVIPLTVLVFITVHFIQGSINFDLLKISLVLLGSTLFGVFSYFLTKKSQNKRYGSQIGVLKQSLKELED